MLCFEFEEILDVLYFKMVLWNINKVNLKYGICIIKISFYLYYLNVWKEKFVCEFYRLFIVKFMKS